MPSGLLNTSALNAAKFNGDLVATSANVHAPFGANLPNMGTGDLSSSIPSVFPSMT